MLGSTLLWLSERQGVFEFIKRNGFSKKLAGRFVAGETLDGAIAAVRSLNANGISASLDLLGESVYHERQAERARDEVIGVLDRIAAAQLDANVSVKLTQMGLDMEVCARHLCDVLSSARRHGIFVPIDMEGSTYTERTLRLFSERLHPEFGDLTGVVIQSYMRRSAADVDEFIEIPFGTQWYPYLMRRLAERPANIAFITMSILKEARLFK
jgi:proline dehydrogenase